ncbi:MAG: hypothetical protein APR54_01615 [Candidatus Cloacimonas sp. SDB]|nr:MAG: hypothetical protein APR54_01615 [Candidatus Cloacimonas sp. SDB]
MITRSDIIDNRKLFLKDVVNDMLAGSEKIKFAVGYLYLSGFYQIAENLEKLEDAKILIGSNLNRQLMEALAETLHPDELEESQEKLKFQRKIDKTNFKTEIEQKITQNIQALPHSVKRQLEIQKLVELVKSKKLEIRVYTRYPLHAKAYIFKYKQNIATASGAEGIAVVGSSNLTMSGFYHNTELNTYVRGQKNYEELNDWFDELWKEAVPFDDSMQSIIENSWALKTISPYDVYIFTLYHLTKFSLERKSSTIWNWDNMPNLYPFQKVAIMQANEWLQKYNGVFICDVVGLGKSFIGAGLLKHLNKRALIISPPGLIEMWERFKERFQFDAVVISRGMLYRGIYDNESVLNNYENRDVVLIDESHHFRNSDTKMYRELQPFLIGKQVILMTATPQNTSPWNIYNQIKLFHQSEENIFPNSLEEPHLRNLFIKVENGEYRLPELLKYLVIRRTRKHIKQFYVNDDYQITFPLRELKTETYNINSTYNDLYSKIQDLLKQLTYSRYDLWKYVTEDKQELEPYIQLKKVIGTLRVFHKINLFKRLESSIYAFRISILNMIDIYTKFIRIIEDKKIVPAGEKIQEIIYRYKLKDVLKKVDELDNEYKTEDFNIDKLIEDLKFDLEIFKDVKKYLETIPTTDDAKYDRLIEIINDLRVICKQQKILIFSEYADTTDYLSDRMLNYFDNVELVNGKSTQIDSKIGAFAPIANEYNGDKVVDILVATDVLSEGFNLQDCSAVINYDLHWNPVRLIQRAGRVDRIGSEADKIFIRNFLPVSQVESEIKLKEKLEQRIKEIHKYIGEDEKILTENERLNESALYTIYDKRDIDELETSEESDFTLDEAEQIIRNLAKFKPEYMQYIKRLQLGLHSIKSCKIHKGSYGFFRAGDFYKLFIKKGENILSDFNEVIAEIRCNHDEKELMISTKQQKTFFNDLNELEKIYKEIIRSDNHKVKINLVIRKAKERIKTLMKDNIKNKEFIENAEMLDEVLNVNFPHHLIQIVRKINMEKQDDVFFSDLVNLYNSEQLAELKSNSQNKSKHIEFVCGEIII